MIRIPYGTTQLTTLAEDMALLRKTVGYKPLREEKELLGEQNEETLSEESQYEIEEDEDVDSFYSDGDLGEDEDEDISAVFDEDEYYQEDDELDEDEEIDEDYELTEEQAQEYSDLLEAFAELDEEEIDGLTQEALDMVMEAANALGLITERRTAGKAPKKGDEDAFKAKGKNTHGRMRRKTPLGVPFSPQGKLLTHLWKSFNKPKDMTHRMVGKMGGKGSENATKPQKQTLALRAISRMAGEGYTARGMLAKYGKLALEKVEELRELPSSERPGKARSWLSSRGGKMTGDRLRIRGARTDRRESTDDLHNLIEEFRSIVTEPLAENYEEEEAQFDYDACEAIIEGFQNIGASAEEMSGRISDHMRSSIDEDEDPRDDPRFEIGSYFEGIARDAGACLDKIISYDEDGDPYFNEGVDPDTALEDLQTITSDFERGITTMEELE